MIYRQIDIMSARAEANRMLAVTAKCADTVTVQLPVSQFRAVAKMIQTLADIGEGSFRDACNWVPLPQFERLRREIVQVRSEYERIQENLSLDELLNL